MVVQAEEMEQAREAADSKALDAAETIADQKDKLAALSAELGKAVQRSQQHISKLNLIKQVQVMHASSLTFQNCL